MVLALFAAIVAADAAITIHRAGDAAPPQSAAAGGSLDRPLPSLPLIDEHGRHTSLAAFRGRYLVLAPSLTLCHETCPLTTGALMRIQAAVRRRGLADRVAVAVATVDPWRDTPARLRAFKRRTGSELTMLTGTHAQIRRLWRFFGVDFRRTRQEDPPDRDWLTHRPLTFDVTHTEALFIVDPRGHWRVLVSGIADVGGRLPRALASLLNDEGRETLRRPEAPWTVPQVLDKLWRLMGVPPDAGSAPAAAAGQQPTGGRLAPGGVAAVRRRLAALRGQPVVVNAWASWCPPCRAEAPMLAAAARAFAGRVAFIGLNVSDDDARARRFLASHPLGYPSYADHDGAAARSLGAPQGLPVTVFLDARARLVHVHVGAFTEHGRARRGRQCCPLRERLKRAWRRGCLALHGPSTAAEVAVTVPPCALGPDAGWGVPPERRSRRAPCSSPAAGTMSSRRSIPRASRRAASRRSGGGCSSPPRSSSLAPSA